MHQTYSPALLQSQETDKEKWVVKNMILLKRLLLALDIWVLHMPTSDHQSGAGGENRSNFYPASAGLGGHLQALPRAAVTHCQLSTLNACSVVRRWGQVNTLIVAITGFPAAFCIFKFHFKATVLEHYLSWEWVLLSIFFNCTNLS